MSKNINIEASFPYLHAMQSNFDRGICKELFKDEADYIWRKWSGENHNLLYFLNLLDQKNKRIIFEWGLNC